MPVEKLEIINWNEFKKGIAPLWNNINPETIPIYNNPFSLIRYKTNDLDRKIIYFPCVYIVDNTIVGFISIYNLSDMHIRPRGIYIKPEYRGKGLGHRMQKAAWDLFPKSFYRSFIITSQIERFCKYSNMIVFPKQKPLWSEFSKTYLTLLCHQRSRFPSDLEIVDNIKWINNNLNEFGLGGTNNLNVIWTKKEWKNYFREHCGNYKKNKFNLDLNIQVY